MPVSEHVAGRAEARVGTLLRGKWRIERVLGVGGMAVVYAATHRNQARVAIKMLHPEVSLDAEVTERFLREGYLANTVDHPGTVKVLDDDVSEEGSPYIVMELLDGETLEARWARKGRRLPLSEVLPIANQVLDVLAAAHDKGVVHRDLKPENLFLTRTGELKILDFGIARLHELSNNTTQTRAGSVMGTPAFMSPEQARGRWDEVDARTDIWAVGATIFTLLTGRYVHEGETVQEQLILAATKPAPSIATLVSGLPPLVVELVDRALAYDKSARWSDAPAMQAALRTAHGIDGVVERLTMPAPSSPGVDAQTIVAPPEVTSAITGSAGVFTSSARMRGPGRRGLLVAASLFAVLGVAGGTAWHFATRATETLPVETAVASPKPPAPVEINPLAPPEPTPATAPKHTEAAQPVVAHQTAPQPSAKPHKTDKPDKPTGAATSTLTGTKPAGAPPNTNPFDRRL